MLDIPLGKALVPVEVCAHNGCEGCALWQMSKGNCFNDRFLVCSRYERKDGKSVIFKLVDCPAKEKL